MKKIICFFILISIFSFAKTDRCYKSQLKLKDDLLVNKIDESLFSGMIINGRDREYFTKGKAQGKWLTFYRNGKLKSIENWKDGHLNGKHIIYRETGVKYLETNYKDGKENGDYKIFYENGNPRIIGKFKEGKPVGDWKIYRKG